MTSVTVADDGGDEITLFEYNGYRYPNFPSRAITKLSSLKIFSDDVIINAYPKSGTHWMYEIVRFLLAGKTDSRDVSKMEGMIDFLPEDAYKDMSSPRILNSHVLFKHLPEELREKKPKIILITRNPKDTAVSYYNFVKKIPFYNYTGEWQNFLKPLLAGKFDYGSWFDYVKHWEDIKKTSDVPILSLLYEDMKEDLYREVKKVDHFLGLGRSDDFIREVCDKSDFTTMKDTKKDNFGHTVYRKGEVGDWKNWFTVAQNEWFDQLYQEKMKDCPLKFRYT